MTRKKTKAKEPIRLRAKQLANGNQSLYLDIYTDGKRAYEFLKLYLIPETDAAAKERNKATMRAANAIKSQRNLELINARGGIASTSSRGGMLLTDWLNQYKERKSRPTAERIGAMIKRVADFTGDGITMQDIDKRFCRGFIEYLNNAKTGQGRPLAAATKKLFFTLLTTALNTAVKEDILRENPTAKLSADEKPKKPESTREYLTIDELKGLMAARCNSEQIRRAFLFSCFCGLRLSDIEQLAWHDIRKDGTQYTACITMQKTKSPLYVPLSDEAMKQLPDRDGAADGDKVFSLPSRAHVNRVIKAWTGAAGITKKVTFHTARHTFATMMLTLGADLYTTSKLLGHTSVATTSIYAKIVDSKKVEAVNLTNGIFNNQ